MDDRITSLALFTFENIPTGHLISANILFMRCYIRIIREKLVKSRNQILDLFSQTSSSNKIRTKQYIQWAVFWPRKRKSLICWILWQTGGLCGCVQRKFLINATWKENLANRVRIADAFVTFTLAEIPLGKDIYVLSFQL